MVEMLKKFFRLLASFFGVQVPENLPDPSIPVTIPPATIPTTTPTTPLPTIKQRRFLRLVKTGKVDSDGVQQLALMLCENIDGQKFKLIEVATARSGLAMHQHFRKGADSVAGSYEPLPEGYWSVGIVEWAGGRGNYEARFDSGVGPVWVGLEPKMKTERGSIGIHLDLGTPGTAGCVGIPDLSDMKRVVAWFDDSSLAPQALTVNWGLGTVESWMQADPTSPVADASPMVDVDKSDECPNSNSRDGIKIDTIILHNTEGSLLSAMNRFMTKSEEVSAHLIIDRDGRTVKMVQFALNAWHAGTGAMNRRSIGIEIVAGGSEDKGMTLVQEQKVIAWVKFFMKHDSVNIARVLPHRDVVSTDCPGSIWKTDDELEVWKKKNLT